MMNSDDQGLELIKKLILDNLALLDEFQALLTGKRWNKIDQQIIAYNEKIDLLRQACEPHSSLPPEFESDFKQLSQRHRRISRLVYLSMEQITEDLDSIHAGSNRLKMILEFAREHKQ